MGGRGICPPNWHVPTDFEWGVLFDAMESSGGTAHQTASPESWVGSNAGTRSKASCSGTSSDTNPVWNAGAGTDNYHFRVIPTDERNVNGSMDSGRGASTDMWSSVAPDGGAAFARRLEYNIARVYKAWWQRSVGAGIRCVKD
jgi:uncharacterized protein (TIGR02145 family)